MAAAEATAYFQSLAPTEPDPVAVTESYKDKDKLAYYLSQVPFRTSRPLKVIISGCGMSGMAFAHEVNHGKILQNVDLTIYEKNAGIGGTWYENRYPGCACDLPVHNYQFAWAPYPYFSSYYASSAEICQYLNDVADQFDLRKHIHTCHKVVGARWDEERSKWTVTVQRLSTDELPSTHPDQVKNGDAILSTFDDECDVFINATGFVNDWKWPAVPNRENYQGRILHSAAWPKEHQSFKGETVALIGNGSSGIQILPAILDECEKVYAFIRNPTWITAGFGSKYAGPNGDNIIFTEEQKEYWVNNPDKYYEYRKGVENELNNSFRIYMKYSAEQQVAKDFAIKQMTAKLAKKPELLKMLLPEFAVGCRRATPGLGYLEALASDKVELVWGEIDSFVEEGLRSASGKVVKVDSIICATGFNVGFAPRFPVIGRNNVDLREEWKQNPKAYLSVTTTDMPNYFVYNGPASAIGHGSLVGSIQVITGYITDLIHKLQTENYGSVCPKREVVDAWQQHCFAWLPKTSWNTPCASTYKNGKRDGLLVSLHAGSRLHYFELLQSHRYEDFDWTTLSKLPEMRFAWLASGFTQGEVKRHQAKLKGEEVDVDLTWFLRPADASAHIRRRHDQAELLAAQRVVTNADSSH